MDLSSFELLIIFVLAAFTLSDDTIDIQWAICDEDAETVLQKLGEDGKEPYKAYNITYYDTSPPIYTALGLGFRMKVKKHGRQAYRVSMIKARFDEESENVPLEADCVWDQYGQSTYFTCGMPCPLDDETEDIWSNSQIAFAERYQEMDWASLVPYGPFLNPKWKLHIQGYKAVFDDVMAEIAGSPLHLMEVEVEAESSIGDEVHEKIDKYLRGRGVKICEPLQLPKTLRLFAALDGAAKAAPENGQTVLGNPITREWKG